MDSAYKKRGIFSLYALLFLLLSGIRSNLFAEGPIGFSAEYGSGRNGLTFQDTSASNVKDQIGSWNIGAFPIFFYSDKTRWAGDDGVQWVKKAKFTKIFFINRIDWILYPE